MGVQVEVRVPVEPGSRFARDAFAGNVGKTLRVNLPGGHVNGTVVSARVDVDGLNAYVTVELPAP